MGTARQGLPRRSLAPVPHAKGVAPPAPGWNDGAVDLISSGDAVTTGSSSDSPIHDYLTRLHAKYADLADGEVATYIPELAGADPSLFGICVATADGAVYEVGDTSHPFTIQSISKPLTYGLILDELGEEAVRARVGVEPTGDAFNAITLDPIKGTPANPMINAGAIAATAMIGGDNRLAHLLDNYSRYTDRQLSINDAVYASERSTGHRNRAIAHLLHGSGVIDADPEASLDLYFQQCAVEVTCRDLALIAATMANGGLNPFTGERAATPATTRRMLAVMATCGMYDGAGNWLYTVGLPAKSGVSGGILAVLPGTLGIAVFSPLLDQQGNSARGTQVCRDLTEDLGLRLIGSGGRQPVRVSHSIADLGSKRIRSAGERAVLSDRGTDVTVIELQGELGFPESEQVIRRIVELPRTMNLAILDFRHVTHADAVAAPFFASLHHEFAGRGGRLVLSGLARHSAFLDTVVQNGTVVQAGAAAEEVVLLTFVELDAALEWCEAQLLADAGVAADTAPLDLRHHELLAGLTDAELDAVTALLERREFATGEMVLRPGSAAEELYLITRGQLSVMGTPVDGQPRRLATVTAGMVLGELAFATGRARTSVVWADSPVECYALSSADMAALALQHPGAEVAILRNLVGITSARASRMRSELALVTT